MKNSFLHFCIISILVFTNYSYSQSFQRLLGTNKNDELSSMIYLSNGDHIVTGTTFGRGNRGSDIYVARIDANGIILWENIYGGSGNESNSVSVINSNGNIVIAGSSSSYNGGSDLDIFLFEITPDGVVNWARNYNDQNATASDEIPKKINLSPRGLILCGTKGSPGSNSLDVIALEIGNDGSRINWQNQIGINTNFGDIPSSIIASRLGGYIVVGGSFTMNSNYDQVIWRLNNLGALQSNIAYGGSNNENAQDLVELTNTDIVVMGNFRVVSGPGLELSLACIRSNNTFNWIKTYGDNGIKDDRAYGFTQTKDGYAFCGYTNGKGKGLNDVLVVWTDNAGKLKESTTIGDIGNEVSSAIMQNSDSSFTILGFSDSHGSGAHDGYLIKTNKDGSVDGNCSSYNIIERSISRTISSYSYNESNPQLISSTISIIKVSNPLNINDFVCSTSLPVNLVSFSCTQKDNGNYIDWYTSLEENSSHFNIEKSNDGYNWEVIGVIKSIGNSHGINHYSYSDDYLISDLTYYRLKQIDNNGSTSYSKIIRSYNISDPIISIFPNPTNDKIYIKNSTNNVETYNIDVRDVYGNIIMQNSSMLTDVFFVSLEGYISGLYFVTISNSEKIFTYKVNKE